MSVFETEVTKIGPEAEMFRAEKMLILFGDNAPEGLAEYCYNIVMAKSASDITTEMVLNFDDKSYKITAVGNVVDKNLNELGHITVKFTGEMEAEMAGTLYVEATEMPQLAIGTKISITK
ncbi:PTS glucitol/sorbitol transporter subunit IIA [Enterococcus alishanensis]|uniref:PTS glucitol/sorbitol transporter subunit IIA n=1 Tax=Enterococcus alishanensis TaxID=1303817 RepID=A0ABS6TCQ2_9ENTE|nr:PTS glucitol/sorbitol transporter subunit IIA [Enterococcus alishanensis]MBV7390662.1 PTS glucitol/sorbitol transporter subunit IIA [Enterococcus alishanensis]